MPEILFTDPDAPADQKPQGISATKAIAVAMGQGQKIYTIDKNHQNRLDKVQVTTSVRNEIRDALNQGKVVTVHEKPLDYHGWKGSGYIILDPDTAAGAYKISGE